MSHPRNAERLQACLGGPSKLLILDDSYHMVHVDRQHALVASTTAAFFGAPAREPTHALGRVDA